MTTPTPPPVTGVILAAGASSRMGRAKALLPIGPDTFVARIAQTMIAGGAASVVVVASGAVADIRRALAVTGAGAVTTVVEHADWAKGQLSSLIAGLEAADRLAPAAAVLVCPVDMPLFTSATVASVLAAFCATGAPVVRPASGDEHGHPVLFSRAIFDELRRADPSAGARLVVRAHAREIVDVAVQDRGAFVDIDTPDDYRQWIGDVPSGAAPV